MDIYHAGDCGQPEGGLIAVSEDPLAFLILHDPGYGELASGLGRLEFNGPPGIYQLEVRVPGHHQRQQIVLPPCAYEFSVPSIAWRSVVPTRSNPLADFLWEAAPDLSQEFATERSLRPGCGRMLIVAWSPHPVEQEVCPFQIKSSRGRQARIARTRDYGGRRACFFDAQLRAGNYEIHSEVPGLGPRAQAIFLEAGWTTQVFAHITRDGMIDLASAVLVMRRGACSPSPDDSQCYEETEVALDALYFGHLGAHRERNPILSRGEPEEPIGALATGFAHLIPFEPLLHLLDRSSHTPTSLERLKTPEQLETLEAVADAGKRLVTLMPHSTDARILLITALWLRNVLSGGPSAFPQANINAARDPTGLLLTVLPRPLPAWLAILLVAILCAAILLMPAAAGGVGGGDFWRLPSLALLVEVVVGLGFLRFLRSHPPAIHETPIFSRGMEFGMRLAALYDGVCSADAPVVDNALRLTGDSLWTRWNPQRTRRQARTDFRRVLKEMEASLGAQEVPSRSGEASVDFRTLREQSLRHLGLALRLPLPLLRRLLRRTSRHTFERILRTPSGELEAFVRTRTQLPAIGAPPAPRRVPWAPWLSWFMVLATVVGLAAILFPVFGNARESARMATCASNLKQLGMAISMYVQDYDDKLPPPCYAGKTRRFWPFLLYSYSKSGGHYKCPQDENKGDEFDPMDPGDSTVSFGYNWRNLTRLSGRSSTVVEGVPLTAVEHPAETLLFAETPRETGATMSALVRPPYISAHLPRTVNGIAIDGEALPVYRHSVMCHVAFVDGHMKALGPAALEPQELWTRVKSRISPPR